jgi:hypothetical protein
MTIKVGKTIMSKFFHSLVLTTLLSGTMLVSGAFSHAVAAQASIADYASTKEPPAFATPEEAVAAFKTALATNDIAKLADLLGLDAAKAKASDGAADTYQAIRDGAAKSLIVREVDGAKILVLGDRLWPMPFPISKGEDGKWSFDTFAGLQEILSRRIGENELQTIDTIRDYVDAQIEYAQTDRDGDGVLEYSQKLLSTEGTHDGLYWQREQGDTEEDDDSPGGAALSAAAYAKAKAGEGYFGYHYRILTGQGANIAGGQYDYIINGNMIVGFGLVAWPVKYGETGVNTFVVNKDGIVYQADLGENTDKLARDIRRFNPGDKWTITDD